MLHGDDPCLLPDGTDAYAHAKKLGRFKMVGGCRCCVACSSVVWKAVCWCACMRAKKLWCFKIDGGLIGRPCPTAPAALAGSSCWHGSCGRFLRA